MFKFWRKPQTTDNPVTDAPRERKCRLTIHWTKSSSFAQHTVFTAPCESDEKSSTLTPTNFREFADWFAAGTTPTYIFEYNNGIRVIVRKYIQSITLDLE